MYLRSKTQGRLRCQKRRSLPQPVKKPQNHFHEYRQKVTVTTLFQTAFKRIFQLLAQTAHVCFHEQKRVHTRLRQQDRIQRLTRRNRGVSDGGAITTLGPFRTFRKPCVARGRTAYFAAFGPWSGVLPKNTESLRSSDALMRVAAPRRRGPAGLRDLFFTSVEIVACTPCVQGFPRVWGRGGITTLGVLRVLPKFSAPACQSG